MNKPLISVVILNYNGQRFLADCLSSLKKQTYPNFEILLVDNGSTDISIKYVEENFADFVKLIKNPINYGFSKGNNIGIRAAKGKYVLTLNNDTIVDPDWIAKLVEAAENSEQIGMCASKIYLAKEPGLIDSIGVNIYPDGSSKQRGFREKDQGQYDNEKEALLPSGCAALYRQTMLAEIGLFDEDFVAYCEDTDLGLRARLNGWQCAFAPKAIVHHLYSATSGQYSTMKAFHVERNHYWVAVKNFPLSALLFVPFFLLLRYFVQALYLAKVKNKNITGSHLIWAIIRAHASAIVQLPLMLRKRSLIQKNRTVSNATFYFWLRKFGLRAEDLALK
ncbi:MAG: glycosyltransferase family 2 protein [bacterium]